MGMRYTVFWSRPILGLFVLLACSCAHKLPVNHPDPETFNTQGSIAFHSGTPEGYRRAAEAFRRASALRPENCAYALNLAQALWFLGTEQQLNFEAYLPREQEAQTIVESASPRCSAIDESQVLRLRALITGRGPGASEWINRAVDLNPTDPMNWLVLGYVDPTSSRLESKDGAGRWVAMKKAADLNPQSALFEYEYGKNVEFARRAQNEASDAFKRTIELNPTHFRALLSLAYLGAEGTDVEMLYEKVVEIAPQFLEGRLAMGSYYASVDEIQKAENQYAAAVPVNPNYDVAEFRLGLLMLQAERPQDAEVHFKRVIGLNPNSFEAHYYLGNIASARKDWNEALQRYTDAIASRTNYAEAEYGIGLVYRQQGRVELALSQFDKVIRILPSFTNAYVARADIRAEQMNFTAAQADYQKAIEGFEMQIKDLTAAISALNNRSGSRVAAAEQKRREREKASIEVALTNVRRAKSSVEQALQDR